MLTDTHTHLQFDRFDTDRDDVITRAVEAGVSRMVVIGTDLESSRGAVGLAEQYPGILWATVGMHPHEAQHLDDEALAELRELAQHEAVVAIGETGLDFYRDLSPRDAQQRAFLQQQQLALEFGLPLVIHSRAAVEECYDALLAGGGFETRVVLHCFTNRPELLERFVAAGCWIGMDGPITFPNAIDARAVVEDVPLDRLLLETDCPYLAPQSHRGRRSEPAHLVEIAERIADLRDLTFDELAGLISDNAAAFYGWVGR